MEKSNNNTEGTAVIREEEQDLLKKRIMRSVHGYRRRNRIRRGALVLGCVVSVLVAGKMYFRATQPPGVYHYARSLDQGGKDSGGEVRLVMGEEQEISLGAADSTVSYSPNGEKVTIGKSKTVLQKKDDNKQVAFNTLIVPYGKRSRIALSDGTTVWLNSGSKLVYPAVFEGDKREVYLEGEGIFEVTHNKEKPFMVLADNHRIRVLGTVFNVSNYAGDDAVRTVLKSGSVEVASKGESMWQREKTIRIKPGTMTEYEKNTGRMTSKEVDVDDFFSWKEGVLILENSRMDEIVKKLARYYNIEIEITDLVLARQTFSGYLDLKDSVENVIETIRKTTDFEYFRSGTGNNKWIIN